MRQIQLVYCPTCRRDVRVAVSDPADHGDGHANLPDSRHVCLDFGERCERGSSEGHGRSGAARCPVFRVPASVMGIERARAGLGPEPRAALVLPCEGCGGRETVQEPAGTAYAVCAICTSTNPVTRGG